MGKWFEMNLFGRFGAKWFTFARTPATKTKGLYTRPSMLPLVGAKKGGRVRRKGAEWEYQERR